MVWYSFCSERWARDLQPSDTYILMYLTGPYAPAILRFGISFPPNYPTSPPSITFISDIFHPLVTPLTTYTYSTGSLSSETVSATDDERLPPGGFSLRHGFPHWFGRAEKNVPSSGISSRNLSGSHDGHGQHKQEALKGPTSVKSRSSLSSTSMSSITSKLEHPHSGVQGIGIVDVLNYMKGSFDNETTMDSLPLEAAGNPGAWNAWRAHRKSGRRTSNVSRDAINDGSTQHGLREALDKATPKKAKLPTEWNWDGVWRERVQKGIDASISSSVLYGSASGADDLVREQHSMLK